VRPPTPPPVDVDQRYVDALAELAAQHGITHVGVASAEPLLRARAEILRRKRLALHDTMQFTYRNPQRSTDPRAAMLDAQSIVACALPYELPGPERERFDPAAAVARYAWVDHYQLLKRGLQAVVTRLRDDGYRAVSFADDNSLVDREVAAQAGLGWFGKNSNLLLPGAGSWFVLGSVVTNAPLPVARTMRPDGCGTCVACVDACPTGAIIADRVIDAARCLAWILQKPGDIPEQWRVAIGTRIYGCDDCQTVCPPNVRFRGRSVSPATADVRATLDPVELLEADDERVLELWGAWYLADRDPRWVRRNALVVLGNAGVVTERVARQVRRYCAHGDPVLQHHARWAAQRLHLSTSSP
jgi:epoxyqueuosine reductase